MAAIGTVPAIRLSSIEPDCRRRWAPASDSGNCRAESHGAHKSCKIAQLMGRTTTLLEGLCGQALSLGADSIEVEHKDSREWVFANKGGMGVGIANYDSSSADGKTLRGNLYAAAKKPVRTVIGGQAYIFKVRIFESFGEDTFAVSIKLAPNLK